MSFYSSFENPGTCQFCFGTFEWKSMTRHLVSCWSRRSLLSEIKGRFPDAPEILHMSAQRMDQPDYWIHFEVGTQASLAELDRFLQDTWMEQTDRPSAFQIGRMRLEIDPRNPDSRQEAAKVRVADALKPGKSFGYEYSLDDVTVRLEMKVKRQHTTSAMNLIAVLTAKSAKIRSTW